MTRTLTEYEIEKLEYELYLLRFFAGAEVMSKTLDFLEKGDLEPHAIKTNIAVFERELHLK